MRGPKLSGDPHKTASLLSESPRSQRATYICSGALCLLDRWPYAQKSERGIWARKETLVIRYVMVEWICFQLQLG